MQLNELLKDLEKGNLTEEILKEVCKKKTKQRKRGIGDMIGLIPIPSLGEPVSMVRQLEELEYSRQQQILRQELAIPQMAQRPILRNISL